MRTRRLVLVSVVLAVVLITVGVSGVKAHGDLVPFDAERRPNDDDRTALVRHGSVHGHTTVPNDRQVSAIQGMSGRQLRRFLRDRGARCDGCVEKIHLVEQALSVRAWPTEDDYVAADLTAATNSAATHLALHHIGSLPADMPQGTIALVHEPPMPPGDIIMGDHLCNQRLLNGTQFCHSISGMQDHARKAMAA